jgi:hypothetical protein
LFSWRKCLSVLLVLFVVFSNFSTVISAEGIANPSENGLSIQTGGEVETAVTEANYSGRLVKGIEPLGNLTFSVQSKSDSKVWYDFTTNENGEFTYQLPDGDYLLHGIWQAPTWYELGQTIKIQNGLVNGRDALLIDVLATQTPPPSPNPNESNVQGTLLKGTTPLANIIFSAHSEDGEKWFDTASNETGQFTFTLPDGKFQIDGIWLSAENKWYVLNQRFTVENGQLQGAAHLEVNLEANVEYNVTGTLKNGNELLKNVTFSLSSTKAEPIWYDAKSDENGRFQFLLPNGTYKIAGIWLDSESRWYELDKEITVDGKLDFVIDLAAIELPEYNVTGSLKNGVVAIPNIWFSIHSITGEEKWYDAQTDSNGHFGFALPNGTYQLDGVWVEAEQKWYVRNQVFTVEGTYQLAIDLSTNDSPSPTSNVHGTVVHNGEPVIDTVFSIHTTNGELKWYDTQTDATGAFTLKIPDASYQLDGIWVEAEKKWYLLNYPFEVKEGKLVGSEQLLIDLSRTSPTKTKVNGIVKDSQGPLADITVAIFKLGSSGQEYFPVTNQSGEFSLELPNGDYGISYLQNNHFSALMKQYFSVKDGTIFFGTKVFTTVEVNVPPVTVTGKVTNQGESVKNASVVVQRYGYDHFVAFTNGAGEFSLRLADGPYSLGKIFHNGTEVDASRVQFEVINGSATPLAIDLQDLIVPVDGNFKAVVQGENGPVENAEVLVSGEVHWYVGTTDATGSFSLELPDGAYRMEHVTLVDGKRLYVNQAFTMINGQLEVDGVIKDALTITILPDNVNGTLVDSEGKLLAQADVWVKNLKGREVLTDTNQAGQFSFSLGDGEYEIYRVISVKGDNWLDLRIPFSVINGKLVVDGMEKTSLTVTLPKLYTFSGTLLVDGLPFANASIVWGRSDGNSYNVANVDANGNFTIKAPNGSYLVPFIMPPGDTKLVSVNLFFNIIDGKLMVKQVEQEKLLISIVKPTLTGTLTDANGPVKYARIEVAKVEYYSENFYGSAFTNSKGEFSFELPDGEYLIRRIVEDGQNLEKRVPFKIQNGKLYVDQLLTTQMELTIPVKTMSGMLLDDKNIPVGNASLSISQKFTNSLFYFNNGNNNIQTQADGSFSGRFEDGEYLIGTARKLSTNEWFELDKVFTIKNGKTRYKGTEVASLKVQFPKMVKLVKLMKGTTPVANADVSLKQLVSEKAFSVKTDSNGEINQVLPDGYYLIRSITEPGMASQPIEQTIMVEGGVTSPTPFVLDVLAEPKQNSVNGVVLSNGKKLANTNVEYRDNTTVVKSFMTNGDGEFSVRIPDGFYRVSGLYNTEIGKVELAEMLPFYVINGQALVNWTLVDSFVIQLPNPSGFGKIVDNGEGIPNASMEVYVDGSTQYHVIKANQDGEFQLRLPNGSYTVRYVNTSVYRTAVLKKFTIVNGVASEEFIIADVNIPFPGNGNVKGVLKDSKNVVRFAELDIRRIGDWGSYVAVNGRGEFQVQLVDGDYQIDEIRSPMLGTILSDYRFTVKNGELTVDGVKSSQLEIVIPDVTVTGQISDGFDPVQNVELIFRNSDNKYYYIEADYRGRFALRLADGDYYLTSIRENTYRVTEMNIPFTVKDGRLVLDGKETSEWMIKIVPNSFNGQIVDDTGKPIGEEGWINLKYKGTSNYKIIKTKQEGFFAERLPDGEYNLYTVRPMYSATSVLNLDFVIKDGRMVIDGKVVDSLALKLPGLTFKGQLVNFGVPVPKNYIDIQIPGHSERFEIFTDSEGKFALRFADGEYLIPRISIGRGYVELNKKITVSGGTTNPSPIVIDLMQP